MDAISFVLGVQSKQLRGNTLADLMYSGTDRDDRAKAFVKLVFRPDPQVRRHGSRLTQPRRVRARRAPLCGPAFGPAGAGARRVPAGCFYYSTQGTWEGCLRLISLYHYARSSHQRVGSVRFA